jgi:hypothetical protein
MMNRVVTLLLIGFGLLSALPQVRVLADLGSSVTVEFVLDDYKLEPVEVNGQQCVQVVVPGVPTYLDRGYPQLPMINRSIIIPDDGQMSFRIIDIEYETRIVGRVAPSKGNLYRNIDPASVAYEFGKIYQEDRFWPEPVIELSEPFILRDYRGLSIRFNAFAYNALRQELKVAKRVVIEVFKAASGGKNVLTVPRRSLTREFIDTYETVFMNFVSARYDSISERAGRMVIICADAFMSNMQAFKTWKRQKGIDTKLVPVSSIGNNATSIKNFIQNEYNAGNLVWVLLVGDGNEVVPAVGTVGSANGADADPVYAYTSGGDYYPDIFVSRFSSRGGTALNIDKQASRSINYEKTPQTGANWYHIGLGIASNQDGGTGAADSTRMNWLRDSLLDYHYTAVNKSYDSWGTTAMIKGFIEAGTGIIDYIGHGSVTSWVNGGGFSNSDLQNLNNPWLLPFVFSVACVVGDFNGNDCFCEVSVTCGDVAQPDGFLAHWGSTINQSWVPPCYGQEGAVNLLTHDRKNTFGGCCFNGACYMIDQYGGTATEGVEMAQTWCIFGDASVQVRSNTPQAMTVNHPASINIGATTFSVNVPGVANALVGLYIDTLLVGHGYTDGAGNVTVTLNPAPSLPGTMYITVTAYNRIPYLGSVPIVSPSGPYVVLGALLISAGGDSQVNPGETVDMGVYAKNIGVATANGVYGLLSESDPYVTISVDSSWYGTIAVNDSSLSSPYYRFAVASNCPNGYSINFDLEFHDNHDSTWMSHPSITVYAPVLTYQSHQVTGGNGNGMLDPGETANLIVTIENEGGATASSVTSTLTTSSPYVTINDGSGNFGTIAPGAQASNSGDPYVLTASSSTPMGTECNMAIIVHSGIYCDTLPFTLTVGQLAPSDTGLYYSYWSGGPHSQCPVFSWYAIDTSQTAHPGTSLNLDDDAVTQVNLPFTFRYYGVNYTQITVGSDGWIAMGYQTAYDQTNTGIPNSDGPSAMTAGMWDDLDPGNVGQPSDIYYYYDATNHRFVVEYFRVEHWPSGNHETFEIILYDPVYWSTPTGDGEIIVQYLLAMHEADNTLGIENSTETIGIQYFLDGGYHALAAPVTNDFAIKYTTYPPDYNPGVEEGKFDILPARTQFGVMAPNPFSGAIRIPYQIANSGEVMLGVYDASGRLVYSLASGLHRPGFYQVTWKGIDCSGRDIPSGVYFIRLEAADYTATKKAIMVK